MASFTYLYDSIGVIAVRVVEVPDANFANGVNYGGANAPGIGIGFNVPNLVGTPEQFTLLDQNEDARTPQVSQYIGGIAIEDGSPDFTYALDSGIPFDDSGDGTVNKEGNAALATLAAGWIQ